MIFSLRKGFTLIELLVVISIIALLSSVVLASLNTAREKARIAAGKQFNASIYHAIGDRAVGVWSFDEGSGTTVGDISGSNNTGTVVATMWSAQNDTPAGTGYSLSFNGSQYIPVGISDMPDIGAKKTISFWMRYSSDPNAQQNMFALVGSGANAIQVGFPGNGTFTVWMYGGGALVTAPNLPSSGVWHHIAYVYDGTTNFLYIDGASVAKTTTTGQSGPVVTVSIGGVPYGWGNFTGYLDDVHIYTSNLSASAVGKLYAEGREKYEVAVK